MGAERVADVDDLQPVEDLEAEVEVERARLVGVGAHTPRAEPCTGAVRGPEVERRAEDGDVRSPGVELLWLGEQGPLGEGEDAAEHVAEVELLAVARRDGAVGIGHVWHGTGRTC